MHHVAAFSFGESLSSPTKEWDDIRALLLATEEGRIKVAGEHTHEEHQAMGHVSHEQSMKIHSLVDCWLCCWDFCNNVCD